MIGRPSDLPDYENPPVVEVALVVRFEPLPRLTGPQLGHFWTTLGEEFPRAEEAPSLPPQLERFDEPAGFQRVFFEFGTQPIPPRVLFVDRTESQVVQVQKDLFGLNWKKAGETPYPRYEVLRQGFERRLDAFIGFLRERGIGEVSPLQCEITYVNVLTVLDSDVPFGRLPDALAFLRQPAPELKILREVDDFNLSFRYGFHGGPNESNGRLYLQVSPHALTTSGERPTYLLTLTAKGRPPTRDKVGILSFLDVGREWIVRGFTEATTDRMHREWRRVK